MSVTIHALIEHSRSKPLRVTALRGAEDDLKHTRYLFVAILAAALGAAPAAAQTASTSAGPAGSPVVNLGYGGLVTGTASVKNTGAVIGVEAGARAWRNLDVFLEAGSLGDVVPQRQIDVAAPLTTFLQQTQGQAASASVKMPAIYGGIGARWVFEQFVIADWARPYVQFGVGGARVKREPTFLLGGSDVTASLAQLGVTVGDDLTATERRSAVTFGFGALVPYRFIYVDVGYRVTSIRTSEAINVKRFNIGVGGRF